MHSQLVVEEALNLRAEGLGARRIARRLGLPVSTVQGWLAGQLPARSRPEAPPRCPACGHKQHDFGDLGADYVYLLGLYLGDGCISSCQRGVFRLRIALDTRYPGIIESAAETMSVIRGGQARVQSGGGKWVDVSAYWKSWPCLFPQHGPGKKHERPIYLAKWQLELVDRWPDQLLRGLIHSDGCRFQNTGRGNWSCPRYGFTQTSDDIRDLFCYACDRLGLHWTRAGEHRTYVSRKADVARLDKFIGPKA